MLRARKKRSVSVAFAALCAFALAASMALPLLSATPSYAEEANPTVTSTEEGGINGNAIDNTAGGGQVFPRTVTFGDTGVTATVLEGQTVDPEVFAEAEAEAKAANTTTYDGLPADAVFVGWLDQSIYSGEPMASQYQPYTPGTDPRDSPAIQHILEEKEFTTSSVVEKNLNLRAVYGIPCYGVSVGIYGIDTAQGFDRIRGFSVPANHGYSIADSPSFQRRLTSSNPGKPIGPVEGYYLHPEIYPGDTPNFTVTYDINKPLDGSEKFGVDNAVWVVYAAEEGEPSTSLPVSGSTGIVASGTPSGPNVPEGSTVELGAEVITSGGAYEALTAKVSGVLAGVFEVNLTVDGKPVHDGFGTIEVTFPVDAKYNGHWVTVWHRHSDGTITGDKVVARDGKVTATITRLSTFALEVGELATDETPEEGGSEATGSTSGSGSTDSTALAKTGDSPLGFAAAGLAAVALAAVGFAGYRSRRSVR